MEDKIKLFVEKFFLSLGANVLAKENCLAISNVPQNFEKFYGKKSPYEFAFCKEDKSVNNELIENGNYLLKTISNFLEGSGKTALLKINFNINPEEEILKKINLNNCKIEKLMPKKKNNFFFRFTFHTTFQYLNQKEKMINQVHVYDNKIVGGDLSNYNITEGNSKDVILPDIKEPYNIAKEKVRELIKPKSILLSNELQEKLEKEIDRIESHFKKENEELRKKKNEEEIFKIKSKEFEKDKLREVKIENQKYSLNLGTKLFNTTLIYYPVFEYDCFLNNGKNRRIIEISYDPLLEKMNELFCESCDLKIKDINFCSSSHISCKNCFSKCNSCNENYCKKCLKTICERCDKKICKKCAIKCFSCGKIMCKEHLTKDKISEKFYCDNCLKTCERCSMKKEPTSFKISRKTGAEICGECFRREMNENVRDIFNED